MGRTSSTVKARYNQKAYDAIGITVPKGRRQTIEALAKENGNSSLNSYINSVLRTAANMTEEQWRAKPEPDTEKE